MEHHLAIGPWDFTYLHTGQKHFLVLPETTPPLACGDLLILTMRGHDTPPLRRWVRYIESGIGYAPDCLGVELGACPCTLGH